MADRIRFKVRARDGRFECDAVAEWRELDPRAKPTAWIACGEAASEARVIEGRLVA